MKVKNISQAVINIDGKFILPNQCGIVGVEWGKNPVVKAYVKEKMITIEKEKGVAKDVSVDDMVVDIAKLSKESSKSALTAFAKKYNVNVEGAETAEDIYSVIFAFVNMAKKNVNGN